MTAVIFLGPTLALDEAKNEIDAEIYAQIDAIFLPPAAQGDVYRVAREGPRAIGIIDGFFDCQPAVWHKEILWALKQGISVFGSSSMGALRAAELSVFGMEGVGRIFADYRDGVLEDDDEVAITHGPAEMGHKPLSEALVNIRYTLDMAAEKRIIGRDTAASLVRIAKGLFYPDRHYPTILARAAAQGLPTLELEALRRWLPANKINQKRSDALLLLRELHARCSSGAPPPAIEFLFNHTQGWEQMTQSTQGKRPYGSIAEEEPQSSAILDELRLTGESYHSAKREAARRILSLEAARHRGIDIDEDTLYAAILKLRRDHCLFDPMEMEDWLEANALTREQLVRIVDQEARIAWIDALIGQDLDLALLDVLRINGEYPRLAAQVRDKNRLLPAFQDGIEQVEDATIMDWYRATRQILSPLVDLDAHALQIGFKDRTAFLVALRRDYRYHQHNK